MMQQQQIIYNATKTGTDFHRCDLPVRLLKGPVGCGKSVADCIEVFRRASEQAPGYDGIRRSRWAIIRNTYPELKSTTIKTWQTWFPEERYGKIKWTSPISHHLKMGDIDLEVLFVALDTPNDVGKLMSFELTGAYINELQFVPKQIFTICQQRVNRYPPKILGAPITWTGVITDTNPPDTDHWIYDLFEQKKPINFAVFNYEPALLVVAEPPTDGARFEVSLNGTTYINNPNADYRFVQNDPDYWIKLVPSYTDEEIKVYLLGDYGTVMDGKAVHSEYVDRLHYANKDLIYNPQLELGLGWDFGLTPALSIVQLNTMGQLVGLDELYSDDMGLEEFAELAFLHLNQHYSGWANNYRSAHDPAGQNRSQNDVKTCQQILKEKGFNSYPAADTNAETARRAGLKFFLRRLSGGQPGYLISARCKRLRKALMGGYQYARVKVSGDERYHDKPLKNIYSHIAEAHEYIAMHYAGLERRPKVEQKKSYTISRIRY